MQLMSLLSDPLVLQRREGFAKVSHAQRLRGPSLLFCFRSYLPGLFFPVYFIPATCVFVLASLRWGIDLTVFFPTTPAAVNPPTYFLSIFVRSFRAVLIEGIFCPNSHIIFRANFCVSIFFLSWFKCWNAKRSKYFTLC